MYNVYCKCYFSISARGTCSSGRWCDPAFASAPPAVAAAKGRSSSMLRGFCIPFSPRMFSIAPSTVAEGTFNYSLWPASAQPVLIVGRQPHPRRMEIREAVFYFIFYFFWKISCVVLQLPLLGISQLSHCSAVFARPIMRNRFSRRANERAC